MGSESVIFCNELEIVDGESLLKSINILIYQEELESKSIYQIQKLDKEMMSEDVGDADSVFILKPIKRTTPTTIRDAVLDALADFYFLVSKNPYSQKVQVRLMPIRKRARHDYYKALAYFLAPVAKGHVIYIGDRFGDRDNFFGTIIINNTPYELYIGKGSEITRQSLISEIIRY